MAQLIVRKLENTVVRRLRHRAAAEGVSVEEAHRRVLRAALVGTRAEPQENFLDYLRSIPTGGVIKFPRSTGLPREVSL